MESLTLLEYDHLRKAALDRYNRLRASNDKIRIVYVVTDDVYETMVRVDPHLKLVVDVSDYMYVTYNDCRMYIVDNILNRDTLPSMFFPAVLEHSDCVYAEQTGYYQGLRPGDVVLDDDGNLYELTEILPRHVFTFIGTAVPVVTATVPLNNINYMWRDISGMTENNKQKKAKHETEEAAMYDTKELDDFLRGFTRNKN